MLNKQKVTSENAAYDKLVSAGHKPQQYDMKIGKVAIITSANELKYYDSWRDAADDLLKEDKQ